MRCFSRMLISDVHKIIIVMNSLDTRFSRNVFEAVQKTRSTCFIGSKPDKTLLLVFSALHNISKCSEKKASSLSSEPIRSDEGATLEMSALYGDKITLSTQLIKPNIRFYFSIDVAPQFL